MSGEDEPLLVTRALRRAGNTDFSMSCDQPVGELLAVLAAGLRPGARVLELGTGVGVGLSWIVHGLSPRDDVSVLSVDLDPALLDVARTEEWPSWVEFLCADGAHVVEERGPFDLIFADAPGGKITALGATVACLASQGILLVDDMDPALHTTDDLLEPIQTVRDTLLSDPRLITIEIPFSTHVIIAVKR
jgi:demethylmenaquinone methyltransferase/2-methoxy-6-polyprenyl-1,4-benzoquinol methylase